MSKFHVTQDETGYFQLTYENDQGELALVSYQSDAPTQLIEDAVEMTESGEFGNAVVVVDPRRRAVVTEAVGVADADQRPAPRRAGE